MSIGGRGWRHGLMRLVGQTGNSIPPAENLAKCNSGIVICEKPMSRHRVALSRWFPSVRKSWRSFVLGVLIVFVAAFACNLYVQGSPRAEHAAIAISWTLIGMLGLACWVCRR